MSREPLWRCPWSSDRSPVSLLLFPLLSVLLLILPPLVSASHAVDGIAFNSALPIKGRFLFTATIDGDQQIISADMATGKVEVLINGPTNDWQATVHPNGSEIVFVSDRDGSPALYRADWDRSGIEQLTSGKPVGDPDWSQQSGKRIVYYYREEEGPHHTNIFSFDLDRKQERRITNMPGRNSTPKISPNGTFIAYSTNQHWPGWDVCLFNIASKTSNCPLKGMESYCRPAWSNSGKFLLYSYGVGDSITLGAYIVESDRKAPQVSMPGKIYDAIFIENNNAVFANNQGGTFDLYFRNAKDTFTLVEASFDLRYPSWHSNSLMQQEIQRLKAKEKS